jgi:hypothetical protein
MSSHAAHMQELLGKFTVENLSAPTKKVVVVDSKASLIEGFEARLPSQHHFPPQSFP